MWFRRLKISAAERSWRRGTILSCGALVAGAAAFGALALLAASRILGYRTARPDIARSPREISQAAARSLETKIRALSSSPSRRPTSFQPIVITEAEANSYLKYRGQEFLPLGVHDPEIHIAPHRVSAAADVDFNELNQRGAKTDDLTGKALAAIFKGKQRVSATGKLETENGQGKVRIENVVVGTTVIPDGLVSFFLENYLQKRYKFDLNKPFSLPDHVSHIELGTGRATLYRNPNKNR